MLKNKSKLKSALLCAILSAVLVFSGVAFVGCDLFGGNHFNLTFESNGGSAVAGQRVEEGRRASMPDIPTRAGFYFTNWYINEALTAVFNFDTDFYRNKTVFAGWSREPVLSAPTAITIRGHGIISWQAPPHANFYYIMVGDIRFETAHTNTRRQTLIINTPLLIAADAETAITVRAIDTNGHFEPSPLSATVIVRSGTAATIDYNFSLAGGVLSWITQSQLMYLTTLNRHDTRGFRHIGTSRLIAENGQARRINVADLELTQGYNTLRLMHQGNGTIYFDNTFYTAEAFSFAVLYMRADGTVVLV